MSSFHDEKLEKIYRKLPRINCKQQCHESCGIIPIGELERKRISEWLGHDPFPTPESIIDDLKHKKICDIHCSLLKEKKCTIYRLRPLICRLFGLTKKMACPFGCVPEKWLDDEVAKKMLRKAKYL